MTELKGTAYAVIMAGGRGERFWPQSRSSHPKQLLRLIGNLTLIEQTVSRLQPLVPSERIFIITNKDYVSPMQSLLTGLPPGNIIGEPVGRDTAPCVALAAALVEAKAESTDAVMYILPADHIINDKETMQQVLADSAGQAATGKIVTIGIKPSFPSTGYGYIQCGDELPANGETRFFKSLGFKEKPDSDTAQKFIDSGSYRWNSGMFVWSVASIRQAFQIHSPELDELCEELLLAVKNGELLEVLPQLYEPLEKISIDYAVMEKVDNIVVADCAFGWDDVGSWTALRNQIRATGNNVVSGLHVGLDTENCIIVGNANHLIGTIDIDDLIIVHTEDATLVCRDKSAQRVKELIKIISGKPELAKFL